MARGDELHPCGARHRQRDPQEVRWILNTSAFDVCVEFKDGLEAAPGFPTPGTAEVLVDIPRIRSTSTLTGILTRRAHPGHSRTKRAVTRL